LTWSILKQTDLTIKLRPKELRADDTGQAGTENSGQLEMGQVGFIFGKTGLVRTP
jgi:hypothetical protein